MHGYKNLLVVLFVSFVTNICNSQQLIYCQSDSIFKIDLENCSTQALFKSKRYSDIAISPNGTLYGITSNELYKVDSIGNTILIHEFPDKGFNSLTIGYNNIVYTVGTDSELYTYDLTNSIEDSLFNIGYASSGDLTFNNNDLWLSVSSDRFVKINLNTREVSLEIDESLGGNPFAFTSSQDKCEGNFGYIAFLQNQEGITFIHQLNFETKELTKICEVERRFIYGLASRYEYLNSIDTFRSIKLTDIKVDTPLCNNNNGSIEFDIKGLYNYLDFELKMNDINNDNSIRSFSNLVEGDYLISVSDQLGCNDSIRVSLGCIQSTNSEDISLKEIPNIYPNPFNDRFNIKLSNHSTINPELFTIKGEKIPIIIARDADEVIVTTSKALMKGIYLLKIQNKIVKLIRE